MTTYQIELEAPAKGDPHAAPWSLGFRDSPQHSTVVRLTPDEQDEVELILARNRRQLRRPRLTGIIREIRGHRFDDQGDAIGFTGELRLYETGRAVIICEDGTRFTYDEKVEVA